MWSVCRTLDRATLPPLLLTMELRDRLVKRLPVERTEDSAALSLQCGCEMFTNCGFISYVSLFFIILYLCFFRKYLRFYVGHVKDDCLFPQMTMFFLIIIVYILFTVLLLFHTPKEGTY